MKIGLIDSGIGGFSILQAAQTALPYNQYVYLADQANFPYSERSTSELSDLARQHVRVLTNQYNCKIIILACNTLSVAALAAIRKEVALLPCIGTVPPVKVAADCLPVHANALVLASEHTAQSEYLQNLLAQYPHCNWTVVGSTALVQAIEVHDQITTLAILTAIRDTYLTTTFAGIVLGCTHFPLAHKQISATWSNAQLFSPSEGVVRQLSKLTPTDMKHRQPLEPIFLTTPSYLPAPALARRYYAIL